MTPIIIGLGDVSANLSLPGLTAASSSLLPWGFLGLMFAPEPIGKDSSAGETFGPCDTNLVLGVTLLLHCEVASANGDGERDPQAEAAGMEERGDPGAGDGAVVLGAGVGFREPLLAGCSTSASVGQAAALCCGNVSGECERDLGEPDDRSVGNEAAPLSSVCVLELEVDDDLDEDVDEEAGCRGDLPESSAASRVELEGCWEVHRPSLWSGNRWPVAANDTAWLEDGNRGLVFLTSLLIASSRSASNVFHFASQASSCPSTLDI